MTAKKIKSKMIKRYSVGQEINLRYRSPKGKIIERRKATVIKFYPHHVLCRVDRCRECFTYAELNQLTGYRREN